MAFYAMTARHLKLSLNGINVVPTTTTTSTTAMEENWIVQKHFPTLFCVDQEIYFSNLDFQLGQQASFRERESRERERERERLKVGTVYFASMMAVVRI